MKSGLFPRHSDDAGQQGIVKSTLHQLPFLWNISFRPQGVVWVNIEKYVYTLRPPNSVNNRISKLRYTSVAQMRKSKTYTQWKLIRVCVCVVIFMFAKVIEKL